MDKTQDGGRLSQTFKAQLIEEAERAGICSEWLERMRTTDSVQTLIGMYYRGTDFCISNRFPSLKLIERYMKEEATRAGIYTDGDHTIAGAKRAIVRGQAHVEAIVRGGEIFGAHVTEEATLRVKALEGATVFVDVYERADLVVNYDPTRPPRSIYITKWQGDTRILINGVDETVTETEAFAFPIVRVKYKDTPYPTKEEEE